MNTINFVHKTMQCRVCLEPHQLNKDYQETLLNSLKKRYANTCVKGIGYISEILSIKKCLHEEVMKMIPNVYFLLEAELLAYEPSAGDQLDMMVDYIFNHGIFGAFEKIKILIPIQNCQQEWSIQQDFSSIYMAHKEDPKKTIRKGSIIKVVITNFRFEKDNFSCIAKISSSFTTSI